MTRDQRETGFVLETERLCLRELDPTDIEFVAEMMSHPEVMRFYPKPLDRSESVAWLERQLERYALDGHGLWLVEERETGQSVGQVGLVMQELAGWPNPRYAEVGYLLHRPFWGRGFATEAASGVRDYAFSVCGYDEVISLIQARNSPSRAVASRLGMTVRGTTDFRGIPHLVYGSTASATPPSA